MIGLSKWYCVCSVGVGGIINKWLLKKKKLLYIDTDYLDYFFYKKQMQQLWQIDQWQGI